MDGAVHVAAWLEDEEVEAVSVIVVKELVGMMRVLEDELVVDTTEDDVLGTPDGVDSTKDEPEAVVEATTTGELDETSCG
jgi:hypothetical protein